MKKLTLFLALCWLVACEAPEITEIRTNSQNVKGLVEFSDGDAKELVYVGRVVGTQLDVCGPLILLKNDVMLEAHVVPESVPKALFTVGQLVQIWFVVRSDIQSMCPVDYAVEITRVQEVEEPDFFSESNDTLNGRGTTHRTATVIAFDATFDQNDDEPAVEPACEWKGTVIETEVTHCGLLIRLDNGIQLEPRNMDKSLKPGQRVQVSYLPWDDQTSICDAGLVVELLCLTLVDEIDWNVSHQEVVRSDTH